MSTPCDENDAFLSGTGEYSLHCSPGELIPTNFGMGVGVCGTYRQRSIEPEYSFFRQCSEIAGVVV
jgi:hypothetical protein